MRIYLFLKQPNTRNFAHRLLPVGIFFGGGVPWYTCPDHASRTLTYPYLTRTDMSMHHTRPCSKCTYLSIFLNSYKRGFPFLSQFLPPTFFLFLCLGYMRIKQLSNLARGHGLAILCLLTYTPPRGRGHGHLRHFFCVFIYKYSTHMSL